MSHAGVEFEKSLIAKAKENPRTVVLPEGDDERVLKAAAILLKEKAVNLIILSPSPLDSKASELNIDLSGAKVINPADNEYLNEFANELFELRKHKGMTPEKAAELIKDKTFFGTMLVHKNIADAMVSGASTTTAETIRPALQFIKMKPGVSTVSGAFIMCLEDRIQFYADCAITPNPTAQQLAEIAISTAGSAKAFGFEPRVAMLSYSTGDSGSGPDVDFVIEATKLAKEMAGEMSEFISGPIQFDAAVDPTTAAKKLPNCKVAGHANVFVFPSLNCGNICYKAVQRTAGALAIGPVLQGLNKPINDLSRGCTVADIVNTVLISALQT